MTRTPKASDFFVDLPGVGPFRYGRRTFGDRAAIVAAGLRYIGTLDGTLSADMVRADLRALLAGTEDADLREGLRDWVDRLPEVDVFVQQYAEVIATHRVLCVEAPAGWDDLALLDVVAHPEWEDKAFELYRLVRQAENRFRQGAGAAGAAAGADDGGHDGVRNSSTVPAGAD